jgi:hypothetical protein
VNDHWFESFTQALHGGTLRVQDNNKKIFEYTLPCFSIIETIEDIVVVDENVPWDVFHLIEQ